MSKRCSAKNRNGKRCGAWALVGKVKCSLHFDPGRAAQMGSKHGPHGTSLRGSTDGAAENSWRRPRRTGRHDVAGSNSLAYISTTLLRAREVSDLERRLEALERSQKSGLVP
jgi:hypothetical protein